MNCRTKETQEADSRKRRKHKGTPAGWNRSSPLGFAGALEMTARARTASLGWATLLLRPAREAPLARSIPLFKLTRMKRRRDALKNDSELSVAFLLRVRSAGKDCIYMSLLRIHVSPNCIHVPEPARSVFLALPDHPVRPFLYFLYKCGPIPYLWPSRI